jgi:hypothetical protein
MDRVILSIVATFPTRPREWKPRRGPAPCSAAIAMVLLVVIAKAATQGLEKSLHRTAFMIFIKTTAVSMGLSARPIRMAPNGGCDDFAKSGPQKLFNSRRCFNELPREKRAGSKFSWVLGNNKNVFSHQFRAKGMNVAPPL